MGTEEEIIEALMYYYSIPREEAKLEYARLNEKGDYSTLKKAYDYWVCHIMKNFIF